MVSDHDPPLQSTKTVLRVLQEQWDECLNLQDLCGLFHQNVVVLESCKREVGTVSWFSIKADFFLSDENI